MGKPKRVIVVDAETDPFQRGRLPLPFLWDVYDGAQHYTFEHTSDCLHFLERQEAVCYAHNGGRFDYHMPHFLDSLKPNDRVMIINGRLAKFKLGLCEFRDSYNILPIPLRDFDKGEIDYSKFEKSVRHLHMEEITKYLHRDTESLYRLVTAFRASYGTGLTLAGSAMKVWQERSRMEAPQSSRSFYNNVSPYYYGGRVQCFKGGIINAAFTVVDIKSAYPYAMLHEHPISTEIDWTDAKKSDPIIPQSLYHVRGRSYGALPSRTKTGLDFPSDNNTREFYVTGWELAAGLDTGTVELSEIVARGDFAETINFRSYIHHFYEMKKSADKDSPDYIFAKLFMNSLYGKFGANPQNYNNFIIVQKEFADAACACEECEGSGCAVCEYTGSNGNEIAGELGNWVVIKSHLEENQERYYNLALAASITGFVRAYLWRHIVALRSQGRQPYYCDTDSICFAGVGPVSGLDIGKELGQWEVEGQFDKGGIAGKKIYAFHHMGKGNSAKDWKVRSKGAKLTPKEVMRVASGKSVKFESEVPTYSYNKAPYLMTRTIKATTPLK